MAGYSHEDKANSEQFIRIHYPRVECYVEPDELARAGRHIMQHCIRRGMPDCVDTRNDPELKRIEFNSLYNLKTNHSHNLALVMLGFYFYENGRIKSRNVWRQRIDNRQANVLEDIV